jgi:thiol:disulfide interchange protein DsbA
MRKFGSIAAAALIAGVVQLAASMPAAAQAVAGKDYVVVNPAQPTETKGKVEVVEFFSYGCPHCGEFEPLLDKWTKAQGKDVELRRVPITFGREVWIPLAKMYYSLEALGELDRMHGVVFDAIHNQRVPLNVEGSQFEWIATKGIDAKKYQDVYKSFSVQSKVARAQQVAAAYKISGVPTMAVGGRFMTSGSLTGSHEGMLRTIDQLIVTARADLGKK